MQRTKFILLFVVTVASVSVLQLPQSVSAGGWATLTLDENPGVIVTDREWEVGFTVLQHGRTPLGGLSPIVTLVHSESGDVVELEATEEGAIGHYTVNLTLPESGTWDWSIAAFLGDHQQAPLEVMASTEAIEDSSVVASGVWQKSWFWAAVGTGSATVAILIGRLGIGSVPSLRNRQIQ